MVATTLDEGWGIPVGTNVYTADGEHLGSVVEGDSYALVVEKGFFFVHDYQLPLSAVDRYGGGDALAAADQRTGVGPAGGKLGLVRRIPIGQRYTPLVHDMKEPDQAEWDRQSIRAFGPPLADHIARIPYTAQHVMRDEGFPSGLQVYWKSHFLTGLDDSAIDILVDHFGRITSPLSAGWRRRSRWHR